MRSRSASPGWILLTIIPGPCLAPFYTPEARLADGIAQHADALDLGLHQVARLHELRGSAGEADAFRRPRGEDVPGLERHSRRELGDEARQLEVQELGVRVLLRHAVHAAADAQVRGIERVRGDDPWAHRARSVEALALVPLPAMAPLDVAPRDVVDHGVSPDVAHRVAFRYVLAAGADNDAELRFPVERGRDVGMKRDA